MVPLPPLASLLRGDRRVGSESWRKTKGRGRGLVAETERVAEPFAKLLVGGRLKSAGVGGPKWTETAVVGRSSSLDRVVWAGVGSGGVKVVRRGDEGWLFPSPRRGRVTVGRDVGASSSSTICILVGLCASSFVDLLSSYYDSTGRRRL
jgi:hypothetical protein